MAQLDDVDAAIVWQACQERIAAGRHNDDVTAGDAKISSATSSGAVDNSIGNELEVVPHVLGNERIRLDLKAKISRMADVQASPTAPPRAIVNRIATMAELNSGQVLLLRGQLSSPSDAVATLFVLRPTIVEAEQSIEGIQPLPATR